jgi:hypothetical protein
MKRKILMFGALFSILLVTVTVAQSTVPEEGIGGRGWFRIFRPRQIRTRTVCVQRQTPTVQVEPEPAAEQQINHASWDLPAVAEREILRRGDFVERIGFGEWGSSAIAEALSPPPDDSHKWFISVITTNDCRHCEALKRDFANSPYLHAFVDVEDHNQSWSHYNVFQIEDQTQAWRWEKIRLGGFPTVLVQPPRNGQFGDPKTVVLQKTGYDGNVKALADAIRSGIVRYSQRVPAYQAAPSGGMQQAEQPTEPETASYDPPFMPPPQPAPVPVSPTPYPFDIPPAPQPTSIDLVSLLFGMLGNLLGSGGMTNLFLLILAALAGIRTFKRATGQPLLLDDDTFNKIRDTLHDWLQPDTPNRPNSG